jgi:hypothetical protein
LAEGWEPGTGNGIKSASGHRRDERRLGLAGKRGLLEIQDVPEENLERLKTASLNKKKTAVRKLILRHRDSENLFYRDSEDPVFSTLIKGPA